MIQGTSTPRQPLSQYIPQRLLDPLHALLDVRLLEG